MSGPASKDDPAVKGDNRPKALIFMVIVLALAALADASYLGFGSGKSQLRNQLEAHATADLIGLEIFDKPDRAPTTAFLDREGNAVRLTDFTGEFLLANFWATWCAPCVVEMPSLDRLQQKMSGTPLQVITISLDRKGFDLVDPFLEEIGVHALPAYLDRSNKLSLEVGATALPTTILIGPDGNFLARLVGPAEWDSEVSTALFEAITAEVTRSN